MSEPLSLYAKFKISEKDYERFLQSPVTPATYYIDWIPWLETQEMHGTISESNLQNLNYQHTSVNEFLNHWMNDDYPFSGNGTMTYENGTLVISVLYFSENYLEYIYHINVLRNIGRYMENAESGFLLIFEHFFTNDDQPVALEISAIENQFLSHISEDWLTEAKEYISKRANTI